MNSKISSTERMTQWMRSSVTLKLLTIGFIILILLIPSSMIESIISERESLRRNAIHEVSSTWANGQLICGPILTIPIEKRIVIDDKPYFENHQVHILPEIFEVDGELTPKTLSRGIYDIVVYESVLSCIGKFNVDEYLKDGDYYKVNWEEAFLTIGISDLRGIQSSLEVNWDNSKYNVIAGSKISNIVSSGVTVPLGQNGLDSRNDISFSFSLDLQGSDDFSLVPVGSESMVSITSDWASPSFSGNFLPDDREVSDSGFKANWKLLELNREFPQSWIGKGNYDLFHSSFGVRLLLPMDDYKKTMRSAKYAIMTIGLTFLIFFLIEIINKRRIHPFQYTLVGLALCLFYILLVSLSEHIDFNLAYLIASIVVVSMIALYSMSVFDHKKISVALCLTLAAVYGFVFVTLQLTDYALLLGSVGLACIIGATMYLTRNIEWYEIKE